MENSTSGTIRQRIFAWALARFNKKYERFAAKYKEKLFKDLSGTVLEIGPGTGANLPHLAGLGVRWIGVEPNPFMHRYLSKEAKRLGLSIEIRNGTVDKLPVADGSIDAVISTLVLCCVGNLGIALKEVKRVLKPGGKFLFIEHVAAPKRTWLRRVQDLITPLWKQLGDGCHPNRETWVEIEAAGFERVSYERITAPVPLVSPQIVGMAVKSS